MATIVHSIILGRSSFPAGAAVTRVIAVLVNLATGANFASANMAADNTATFNGVPAGTYKVAAQAYNGGVPVGMAVSSATITAQDPPVSLAIPSGFGAPTVTA